MKKITLIFFVLILFSGLVLAQEIPKPYAKTNYKLKYTISVSNTGPSTATDIPLRVALLKGWKPFQELQSISVVPEPDEIYTDKFGNRFAKYKINELAPNAVFQVVVTAEIVVNSMDFFIKPERIGKFERKEEEFKKPSQYIESDAQLIIETAKSISKESEFVTDTIWNSYIYVIDNLQYQQQPGEPGALWALQHSEGGSSEFSDLFIALLRANNIPSKRISGWGKNFVKGEKYTVEQLAHGWAEFYLPEYGWITADPTFGINSNFDYYAKHDDKHIILTKGNVHFFTRGKFNAPYGNTNVRTDYDVFIENKKTEYVSFERHLIVSFFFIMPVLFGIFILYKAIKSRR